MLYKNLPDYTQRHGRDTARRPGMPSALPKPGDARRMPMQPAGRPVRSSLPAAWNRPASQPRPGLPIARGIPAVGRPAIHLPSFRKLPVSMPDLRLPKFSLRPRAVIAMLVVALFGISLLTGIFPPPSITQAFAGLTTSDADKAAAARKERMDVYTSEVNKLIAAHPGEDIAVATIDLSDNSSLTLGDQGTFTAASTAKMLTAVTLLDQVEHGKLTLGKYISGVRAGDLLERMIVQSDNNAWKALNDYLTHPTLESYADSLGWSAYNSDINSLRPADMAGLSAKLYRGELLSPENTKLLLGLMQDANKQNYIVTNVPIDGYTVYHKAGWLDGLMHDVAIIQGGQKSIVLAIYTYSGSNTVSGDTYENQELFAKITAATLKAYFPPAAAPVAAD
jgi:beta-lactamase class A